MRGLFVLFAILLIAMLGCVTLMAAVMLANRPVALESARQAYEAGFNDGTVYALTAEADSTWAPWAAADSLWESHVRGGEWD